MLPEHGVVPVSSECQQLFPTKIVSRLVKWTAIPYEDYAVSAEHEAESLPSSSFPAPFQLPSSSHMALEPSFLLLLLSGAALHEGCDRGWLG